MTSKRLRDSILQAAIQGQLVPQEPSDTPAALLLERIQAERERLIKEKKIRHDKNASVIYRTDEGSYYERNLTSGEETCIDDEIPFDIPDNWRWSRFGQMVEMRIGKTPTRGNLEYWSNGCYSWVSISDMTDYGFIETTKEQLSDIAVENVMGNIAPAGTLLMSFKLTIGRTAILGIDAFHNEAIISIYPYVDEYDVTRDYLFYVLPLISNLGETKDAIKGRTLNSKSLYNLLIPIPPLEEQERIVARIEELMTLVDQYDQSKVALDELESTLPDMLQQSILQAAIQGQLVPQEPSDTPAALLLERIQAERERLIEERKIRRDKNASVIYRTDEGSYYERNLTSGEETCIDDEIPFDIPDSWQWTRLGCIGDWGAGATPAKGNLEYYNGGTMLWLRTGELNNGVVYDTEIKITEKALQECSLRLNKVGDVMIAMYGATIGKLAIAGAEMTTNQACCACTPIKVSNWYLFYFLMASKTDFIKKGAGGAQPNISREKLTTHLFPIPPLEEQERIVARIEELMRYTDRLKSFTTPN